MVKTEIKLKGLTLKNPVISSDGSERRNLLNDVNKSFLLLTSNNARRQIARQVVSITSNTYWEIGRLLYERKIDRKHGSSIVRRRNKNFR